MNPAFYLFPLVILIEAGTPQQLCGRKPIDPLMLREARRFNSIVLGRVRSIVANGMVALDVDEVISGDVGKGRVECVVGPDVSVGQHSEGIMVMDDTRTPPVLRAWFGIEDPDYELVRVYLRHITERPTFGERSEQLLARLKQAIASGNPRARQIALNIASGSERYYFLDDEGRFRFRNLGEEFLKRHQATAKAVCEDESASWDLRFDFAVWLARYDDSEPTVSLLTALIASGIRKVRADSPPREKAWKEHRPNRATTRLNAKVGFGLASLPATVSASVLKTLSESDDAWVQGFARLVDLGLQRKREWLEKYGPVRVK